MLKAYLSSNKTLLFILVVIAVWLRTYQISEILFFGPEQGRDALAVKQIIGGDLTLLGPKTDIEGVFHGPMFYYLLTIPYFLFDGNPVKTAISIIILNSLSVLLIFYLGKQLFSPTVGIISAILLTFSPRAIDYNRWLSNATLVPLFSLLFIFFLFKVSKKKYNYLILVGLLAGLLIQLQLLNGLFILPLLFFFFLWLRKLPPLKHIFIAVTSFLFALSSFFIFDIRPDFLNTRGIINLLESKSTEGSQFTISFRESFNRFGEEIIRFISPNLTMIASFIFILGVIIIISRISYRFNNYSLVILWLSIPLIMLSLSRNSVLNHYFLFSTPAIILTAAIAINQLKNYLNSLPVLTVILLLIANIIAWKTLIPWGITIGQEKKVIDFVYQTADGNRFRFEAFTIPYFWQDAWQYMFDWYGQANYHYSFSAKSPKFVYFIWEEEETNFQKDWLKNHVAKYRFTGKEAKFGNVWVQQRQPSQ